MRINRGPGLHGWAWRCANESLESDDSIITSGVFSGRREFSSLTDEKWASDTQVLVTSPS